MKMPLGVRPLIISDICYGPISIDRRLVKQDAYKSGRAFYSHVNATHNGKEDIKCPACQKLKALILS